MIAWLVWLFVAPHLLVIEGLVAAIAPVRVDVGTAICLVLALWARPRALPGLLFGLALARALLFAGDLPLHYCALAMPVAVLLPLRGVFFRHSAAWQAVVAGFLAVLVPKAEALFGRLTGQTVDVESDIAISAIVLAMLIAPPIAFVLRRTPPLSSFVERFE